MSDLRETSFGPRVCLGGADQKRCLEAAELLEERGATHMGKVLRAVAGALRSGQRISLVIGPPVGEEVGSEEIVPLRPS